MYTAQLDSISKLLREEELAREKQKKKHDDLLTEAASLKPDEVLTRAFADFQRKAKFDANKSMINFSSMLNLSVKPAEILTKDDADRLSAAAANKAQRLSLFHMEFLRGQKTFIPLGWLKGRISEDVGQAVVAK